MDNFTKKYLQDILNAIDDIETFFDRQLKLFEEFCRDIRLQRATGFNHLVVLSFLEKFRFGTFQKYQDITFLISPCLHA